MITRHYRCAACQRTFAYDHHPSIDADPLPDECPYLDCQAYATPTPALVAPHLATKTIARTVDNLNRSMEAGAEFRAQVAMEQHGLTTAEANQLKLTDQKDHLHYGDTSAPGGPSPEFQQMVANAPPQSWGMVNNPGIAAGMANVHQAGYHAHAGLRTMLQVRDYHAQHGAAHVAAGANVRAPLANPTVISERPALETQVPGYKRRI